VESHIEIQYLRAGNPVGRPIIVNSVSTHPDITDLDFGDYVAWVKDAFSIAKDIYGAKSLFDWFGVVGDIGTGLKDVFQGKTKAAKSVNRLMLLAPVTIPSTGPAVDEARIVFQASSDDDLTTSFGSVTPEGKIIDLGENRYDRDGIHFYEKSYRIPLQSTPTGPYFFIFGSGDEGDVFNVALASFLTVGIAQHRHSGFLIQSTVGYPGDLQLVVQKQGGGMSYYRRAYNEPGWHRPVAIATDLGSVDAISLIQSTFGTAGAGNLELVARVGTHLYHLWHSLGDPPNRWSRAIITSGDFSGNPALLQGTFGITGHFELVVPRAAGGMFYFRRDNDPGAKLAWRGPFEFAVDVGRVDSVCLLQSNFGPPGVGQLEVVARMGTGLAQFIRLNDDPPYVWSGPRFFAEGVAGNPAVIQGSFGTRGNYELVVPRVGGGFAHYFRNNDPVQNLTWNHTADFGMNIRAVESVSLIQSNVGSYGLGELFVVAKRGLRPSDSDISNVEDGIRAVPGELVSFRRSDFGPYAWSGPQSFLFYLALQVAPYPVEIGRPVTVTIHAHDAETGAVVDRVVMLDDDPADGIGPRRIGRTNVPIEHTFTIHTDRQFDPETRSWRTLPYYPVGRVVADGYVDAEIDWGFPA